VAPITELTSYGLVGKYITRELLKQGREICLHPIGNYDDDQFILDNINLGNLNGPFVKLFHQNQLQGLPETSMRIGFPIFELDRLNKQEQDQLRHVDKLFVCSQWAKDVAAQYFPANLISIIPLGYDPSVFYPQHANRWYTHSKTTRFLNIGKWEYRKGHDILVEAFAAAFSAYDDVSLTMHCENIFIGEENKWWEELYRNKLGGRVKFTYRHDYPKHTDLANLYASNDCFVAPTRAEGWGMPILEAMACGLQVITTNVTGQSEYISGENALLVEADGTEIASDGAWFFPERTEGGRWAKLGDNAMESLVENLRKIHALKNLNGYVGPVNMGGAAEFTWDNTVDKFIKGVEGVS